MVGDLVDDGPDGGEVSELGLNLGLLEKVALRAQVVPATTRMASTMHDERMILVEVRLFTHFVLGTICDLLETMGVNFSLTSDLDGSGLDGRPRLDGRRKLERGLRGWLRENNVDKSIEIMFLN